MIKTKKLIIIGDSAFAEIAQEYFNYDSEFEVVAHAVEQSHITKSHLNNIEIIPFENIIHKFPPSEFYIYVAIPYTNLNRLRTRLKNEAKDKGYKLASYISSRAFVWHNVQLGEHIFIFEDNTIQPFVTIGENSILWSGNHIGHHSHIGENVFISSHAVISGFCNIGDNCFIGVNSTIANNVTIKADCWLSPNSVIMKDTEENILYKASPSEASGISTTTYFKVPR